MVKMKLGQECDEGTRAFQEECRGGTYREVCEARGAIKQEVGETSEKLPPLTHAPLRTVISTSLPPLNLTELPLRGKFQSWSSTGEVMLVKRVPSLRQEWWGGGSPVGYRKSTTSRERVLWEKGHPTQVRVEEEGG